MQTTSMDNFFSTVAKTQHTFGSQDFQAIPDPDDESRKLEGLIFREAIWVGNKLKSEMPPLGLVVYQGAGDNPVRTYYIPVVPPPVDLTQSLGRVYRQLPFKAAQ